MTDADKQRLEQDLAMMRDPDRWPDLVLHLKTRPRRDRGPEQFLKMRFAVMEEGATHVTMQPLDGSPGERVDYASLEDLATEWTVD